MIYTGKREKINLHLQYVICIKLADIEGAVEVALFLWVNYFIPNVLFLVQYVSLPLSRPDCRKNSLEKLQLHLKKILDTPMYDNNLRCMERQINRNSNI